MKRWIAFLAALALLICSLPMVTFAEMATTVAAPAAEQYDNVYYTDLFFGYETHDLFYSEEYRDYINKNETTVNRIFDDYMESPGFFWTTIKTSVNSACNIREWFSLISDAYGTTDYNYSKALDAANVLFVQHLFDRSGIHDKFGMMSDGYEAVAEFYEGYDYFLKESVGNSGTGKQLIEAAFSYMKNDKAFTIISDSQFNQIQSALISRTDVIADAFSAAGDILGAVEAISIALMMEEMRIQMIDNILRYATTDMTLYDGMSRLRTQLRNGFASYFIDNYLKEEVLDKLADSAIDLMGGGLYAAVSGVVSVASYVVFDLIFDVAGMDDVLLQTTLRDYTVNFAQILKNLRLKFDSEAVTAMEIYGYEWNFAGYLAATDAALEASEALTLDSNHYLINQTKFSCQTFNYSTYILKIIERLEATPNSERKLKSKRVLGTYEVKELHQATDEPYVEYVYLFNNTLFGNVKLVADGKITVPSWETYEITGDITAGGNSSDRKASVVIEDEATLVVGGTLNIESYGTAAIGKDAKLTVNGDFTAKGTVRNNGTVTAKGHVQGYGYSASENGTIVFAGSEQQTVSSLTAHNMEVTNPAGVKYMTNVTVNGTFNLHGNPLDNNGHQTLLYSGADLVDGSDYGDLMVRGAVTLDFSSKGNITVAADGYLTVPAGEEHVITGDITVGGNSSSEKAGIVIEDDATLVVGGNLKVNNYGSVTVGASSQLTVNGDFTASGTVRNNGTVTAKGYVQGYGYSASENGTIVFAGSEQQTVSSLTAHHMDVTNPAGVKYMTNVTVNGTFNLHGNPLDNNGRQTLLYSGADLVDGSDYGDLMVRGAVTLDFSSKGNITVMDGGHLTVPLGGSHEIIGDITVGDNSSAGETENLTVEDDAMLVVGGNLKVNSYGSVTVGESSQLTVNGAFTASGTVRNNGTVTAKGHVQGYGYSASENSTIVFAGSEQQTVSNLTAYNIEVTNPAGVKYMTNVTVNGTFNLHGNPLDNNGHQTLLYSGADLVDGSDYGDLMVRGAVTLDFSSKGNIIVTADGHLTVPTGEEHVITGDITVGGNSSSEKAGIVIEDDATLVVGGNLKVNNYGSVTVGASSQLTVNGDFTASGTVRNNGTLTVKENIQAYGYVANDNSVIIFTGDAKQTVSNLKSPVIILENKSEDGVVFSTAITVSKLFDHNGNTFTLYNNGNGSNFVDYDGDGIKDHEDIDPTAAYVWFASDALEAKNDVLTGVACDMTVEQLYANISSMHTITIYNGNQSAETNATVATGNTLVVSDENGTCMTYTLAVTGDVNGDGMMNTRDARAILQALANGENTLTAAQTAAADMDGNDVIAALDARQLLLSVLAA